MGIKYFEMLSNYLERGVYNKRPKRYNICVDGEFIWHKGLLDSNLSQQEPEQAICASAIKFLKKSISIVENHLGTPPNDILIYMDGVRTHNKVARKKPTNFMSDKVRTYFVQACSNLFYTIKQLAIGESELRMYLDRDTSIDLNVFLSGDSDLISICANHKPIYLNKYETEIVNVDFSFNNIFTKPLNKRKQKNYDPKLSSAHSNEISRDISEVRDNNVNYILPVHKCHNHEYVEPMITTFYNNISENFIAQENCSRKNENSSSNNNSSSSSSSLLASDSESTPLLASDSESTPLSVSSSSPLTISTDNTNKYAPIFTQHFYLKKKPTLDTFFEDSEYLKPYFEDNEVWEIRDSCLIMLNRKATTDRTYTYFAIGCDSVPRHIFSDIDDNFGLVKNYYYGNKFHLSSYKRAYKFNEYIFRVLIAICGTDYTNSFTESMISSILYQLDTYNENTYRPNYFDENEFEFINELSTVADIVCSMLYIIFKTSKTIVINRHGAFCFDKETFLKEHANFERMINVYYCYITTGNMYGNITLPNIGYLIRSYIFLMNDMQPLVFSLKNIKIIFGTTSLEKCLENLNKHLDSYMCSRQTALTCVETMDDIVDQIEDMDDIVNKVEIKNDQVETMDDNVDHIEIVESIVENTNPTIETIVGV